MKQLIIFVKGQESKQTTSSESLLLQPKNHIKFASASGAKSEKHPKATKICIFTTQTLSKSDQASATNSSSDKLISEDSGKPSNYSQKSKADATNDRNRSPLSSGQHFLMLNSSTNDRNRSPLSSGQHFLMLHSSTNDRNRSPLSSGQHFLMLNSSTNDRNRSPLSSEQHFLMLNSSTNDRNRSPLYNESQQSKAESRFSKAKEFPNIRWNDYDDERTQKAILLYNQRIDSWQKIKELHPQLEDKPELVRFYIAQIKQNRQANQELQMLNEAP